MTFDYPDPLEVGVEVLARAGRFGWGLVAADGLTLSGALPVDATRVDAQLAVLAALLEHPGLAGVPVNLFCADPGMHRAVSDLRHLVPHVEPRPLTERLKTHPRITAARAVAHLALDTLAPREAPRRLVAATDGSFGRHGRLAGWGWVTDSGEYGFGHLEAHDALVAELAAIRALLSSVERDVELHVLSDSRAALALVERAQIATERGTAVVRPTGVRKVDAQVAAISELLVGREVTFAWVRGHSGHPLNDGADRLAVHARRTVSAGVERATSAQVAANIAAETAAAVAHAREQRHAVVQVDAPSAA